MSYLECQFGERQDYIAVYEFTKTTWLLHVHVTIFVPFLMLKRKITRIWRSTAKG